VSLRPSSVLVVSFFASWSAGVRAQPENPEELGPAAADLVAAPTVAVPGDSLAAQPGESGEEDFRFDWGALPYVAGSSDYGVLFGAVAALVRQEKGVRPYAWRGELSLSASVMDDPVGGAQFAQHDDSLRWDIPNLLHGWLRFQPQILFQRTVNAGYFGLGNASSDLRPATLPEVDRQRWFQYIYTAPELRLNAQIRLTEALKLLVGVHGRYVLPEAYATSLYAGDRGRRAPDEEPLLRGTDDHGLALLALGLLLDTRDDETVPTLGMLHELSLRGAVGFRDTAEFAYGGLTAHVRYYLPLADRSLVLGLRVLGDVLFGEPPFYELGRGSAFFPSELPGGKNGIRGVPAGRFAGRYKLLGSAELRSMFWNFDLWGRSMSLGAVAFFDWGRVWVGEADLDGLDGFDHGMKFGVGGGIHFQWGSAAVFRFELAWSPDAASADPDLPLGIYVAFAQAF